jgi:uncharacterized membrane protein
MPSSPVVAGVGGERVLRIAALDATRGIAMALVCLSHFAWVGMQTLGAGHWIGRTIAATMVAAPTFMLLSGMTLGYVHRSAPEAYAGFSAKLFERGLFLLTIAHLVLLPSRMYLAPGWAALRSVEMTDTIGFCIIAGPLVVTRVSAALRVALSIALVVLAWALILSVPDMASPGLRALQHALIGHREANWWYSSFPLVPWFSVYLFGTTVGERLRSRDASVPNHNTRLLLSCAAWVAAAAVLLQLAVVVWSAAMPHETGAMIWMGRLADPFEKFPPSPAYLLVFTSAGLGLAAMTSWVVDRGSWRWLSERFQIIGRASLFVFIVQSYLYYFVELHWLHPLAGTWPLAFAGSLVVVFALAKLWLRLGGNRLLTVPGVRQFRARIAAG